MYSQRKGRGKYILSIGSIKSIKRIFSPGFYYLPENAEVLQVWVKQKIKITQLYIISTYIVCNTIGGGGEKNTKA